MTKPPMTLCFDLDGTLVDTAPDLLNALDSCLAQAGHPKPNHTLIRPIIGSGAKAMIKRAFESDQTTQTLPDETEIDRLWHNFIDHYRAHIADESRPFPGALKSLKTLKEAGFLLAVCTNKPISLTTPLLQALNLTHLFDAVIGINSTPFAKPDARILHSTIQSAGGNIQSAIMIGDSKTDIDAARNANIPVIGVTFGYSEHPIESLQPDKIMNDYDELELLVDQIINQMTQVTDL